MKYKVILGLAFGLGISFATMAGDWPVWRGPDHNSIKHGEYQTFIRYRLETECRKRLFRSDGLQW